MKCELQLYLFLCTCTYKSLILKQNRIHASLYGFLSRACKYGSTAHICFICLYNVKRFLCCTSLFHSSSKWKTILSLKRLRNVFSFSALWFDHSRSKLCCNNKVLTHETRRVKHHLVHFTRIPPVIHSK